MLDALRDWLLGLMTSALNGFDSMLSSATGVLTSGLGDWNSVVALSSTLRPFCYTIIGICLLIETAEVLSKVDIIKWEHGLKLGVKVVLSKVCIDIAPTFLQACYAQAQEWITSLSSGGSTLGSQTASYLTPLVGNVSGFGNILGMFLSTFIVLMAIKICGLMVQVIAYGRMFELYVYLVVSPVPCSFFPLGNGDGGGVSRITQKFFKSFIAVCLQGVMMIIVMRLFDVIIGGAVSGTLAGIAGGGDANAAITDLVYTMLLGAITLVMAVVKCGSWSKGILDAM
ncbi:hypothetical protein OBV_p-00350 (plasmid) [Oscillibacter valericigenes Sjm18-20]|nr:hypothetical protein OBV_p-00350 [Oscillibacter valericigenes Sjm18-20]